MALAGAMQNLSFRISAYFVKLPPFGSFFSYTLLFLPLFRVFSLLPENNPLKLKGQWPLKISNKDIQQISRQRAQVLKAL
jgi:hypothetical protein